MAKKIQISAKTEGFRRAGIAHSSAPQLYPTDHFSAAELKALKEEPQLVVVEVDVDDEKKAGKTEKAEKSEKTKN